MCPRGAGIANLTPEVEQAVRASGIREGLCLVNAMHITASVFINDNESGLHRDFERWLEKLAPEKPHSQYDHNRTGEDNGDAHLKRSVMGREVVVAVTDGALDLGPLGADFLRRIRRLAPQARFDQDHRRVMKKEPERDRDPGARRLREERARCSCAGTASTGTSICPAATWTGARTRSTPSRANGARNSACRAGRPLPRRGRAGLQGPQRPHLRNLARLRSRLSRRFPRRRIRPRPKTISNSNGCR